MCGTLKKKKKIHVYSFFFWLKTTCLTDKGWHAFLTGLLRFKNLLKISLQDLIPQSCNGASEHSGMHRHTHTQPKWTVIWKHFCDRSVPEAKLPFMIVLSAVRFEEGGLKLSITMKENKYPWEYIPKTAKHSPPVWLLFELTLYFDIIFGTTLKYTVELSSI